MTKWKKCPLCGSCFGMDSYIYSPNGIWYHYFCGNKVFEKTTTLTIKERTFIKRMEKYGKRI